MDGWIDGQIDAETDRLMGRQENKWKRQKNSQTVGWMGRQINKQIDRLIDWLTN